MMGTVPLDSAVADVQQSLRALLHSIDSAMTADEVSNRLAMTTTLGALRYIEKHGLTDGGRRQLRTAIECCHSVLGIEA